MSDSKRRGGRLPTNIFDRAPVRAVVWLASVALIAAIVISLAGDGEAFHLRDRTLADRLELAAIAATAIAATVAAFLLAEPNSPTWWSLVPVPPLALWIGVCARDCLDRITIGGASAWDVESCLDCVLFILAVSIPLGTSLIVYLHRSQPRYQLPVRAAAFAGVGIAAIAIGLLQINHPLKANLADATAHIVAAAIVFGVITYSTRLLPRIGR